MDLLSGYGSEDSGDSQVKQPTQEIEPAPKRAKNAVEKVSPHMRRAKQAAHKSFGHLDKKKSRWTKSSAFLCPVGYDANDVEVDDDTDDRHVGGAKAMSGDSRPLLTAILPAPTHSTHDKNAPEYSKKKESHQNSARDSAANIETGMRNINPAPNVQTGMLFPAPAIPMTSRTENMDLPEGVSIKEISGAALRRRGAESIADTTGMRAALGDEYERKLRSEAARVGNVSKVAKRKNQLSSLFVNAKTQEIEQMEKHASGVKTKTETQKKYGW